MDLLNSAFAALLASGPIGLFAALELLAILAMGYGLWYFMKQRNGHAVLTKLHSDELKRLQSAQLKQITELHESYQKQIGELHALRIADVKEMTDDYSELATQIVETISKLNNQLEMRGHAKQGG